MPTPRFMPSLDVVETAGVGDYTLLDAGSGRKMERFGPIVVDRPEPQALWSPRLPRAEWSQAHAVFSASGEDEEKGRWRIDRQVPPSWPVRLPVGPRESEPLHITLLCKLQGLWHLGLFPEQIPHWSWMLERVGIVAGEQPRVLNLFGYTGAASLLAAAAGAEVTHVDASKKAIAWGRENQAASGLDHAKVRWICDDARKFAAREVRRKRTYHVILIDPPKFGRGPEGEVWNLFGDLPALLADCTRLLAARHGAMILTVYAIRASALAFDQAMREHVGARAGSFHSGELALRARSGVLVPTSLFVRFQGAP